MPPRPRFPSPARRLSAEASKLHPHLHLGMASRGGLPPIFAPPGNASVSMYFEAFLTDDEEGEDDPLLLRGTGLGVGLEGGLRPSAPPAFGASMAGGMGGGGPYGMGSVDAGALASGVPYTPLLSEPGTPGLYGAGGVTSAPPPAPLPLGAAPDSARGLLPSSAASFMGTSEAGSRLGTGALSPRDYAAALGGVNSHPHYPHGLPGMGVMGATSSSGGGYGSNTISAASAAAVAALAAAAPPAADIETGSGGASGAGGGRSRRAAAKTALARIGAVVAGATDFDDAVRPPSPAPPSTAATTGKRTRPAPAAAAAVPASGTSTRRASVRASAAADEDDDDDDEDGGYFGGRSGSGGGAGGAAGGSLPYPSTARDVARLAMQTAREKRIPASAAAAAAAAAAVAALSAEEEELEGSEDGGDDGGGEEGGSVNGRPRKRRRGSAGPEHAKRLALSRERNRLHARKSRLRKKFFVDSLKATLDTLEDENKRLKGLLEAFSGRVADELLAEVEAGTAVIPNQGGAGGSKASKTKGGAAAAAAHTDAALVPTLPPPPASAAVSGNPKVLLAAPGQTPSTVLGAEDYALVQALTNTRQNFVVTDPTLPDNPIVFASQGFYELTGYCAEEVIGRNCRFLQGPYTDPDAIAIIRKGLREGLDTAVCLVNYRKDGSTFWNRFFVAPLRAQDGRVVNFVGVQSEVKESVARALLVEQDAIIKREVEAFRQQEADAAAAALSGGGHGKSV